MKNDGGTEVRKPGGGKVFTGKLSTWLDLAVTEGDRMALRLPEPSMEASDAQWEGRW